MIDFAGRGLLLDVEGTTTSIAFVYDTLFPYARNNLRAFLAERAADPDVLAACEVIARESDAESLAQFLRERAADPHALESEVLRRMDADDKSTGLKQLQGLIWRAGYERGELRGHVYPDVPVAFAEWTVQGADIRIYSSGSVEAQRLLFSYSTAGPLDGYIRGHYDTRVGPKRSGESYRRIVGDMRREPPDVLFFSDTVEEVAAAGEAGLATVLVRRTAGPAPASQPVIAHFGEVRLI
ncbi:MAG TPA: acireductone synthase [Gemmatimonadaceae bacterium]